MKIQLAPLRANQWLRKRHERLIKPIEKTQSESKRGSCSKTPSEGPVHEPIKLQAAMFKNIRVIYVHTIVLAEGNTIFIPAIESNQPLETCVRCSTSPPKVSPAFHFLPTCLKRRANHPSPWQKKMAATPSVAPSEKSLFPVSFACKVSTGNARPSLLRLQTWPKTKDKGKRFSTLLYMSNHPPGNNHISHLSKRKTIFKSALVGDMVVTKRVVIYHHFPCNISRRPSQHLLMSALASQINSSFNLHES